MQRSCWQQHTPRQNLTFMRLGVRTSERRCAGVTRAKSEVRQKHDILTFNFQSNAKFDAKNNSFAMRLSPTVDPWEPRGSTITGYPATSALVRTHP